MFPFKKRANIDKKPFNITQFLILTGIAIVLINILASIIGVWFEEAAMVSKQISMGVLLMIVIAAVIIPFMLIRRQLAYGAGMTGKDLLFIMLTIGLVIFLMIVIPNIFSLPKPFSIAQLQLQAMFVP